MGIKKKNKKLSRKEKEAAYLAAGQTVGLATIISRADLSKQVAKFIAKSAKLKFVDWLSASDEVKEAVEESPWEYVVYAPVTEQKIDKRELSYIG